MFEQVGSSKLRFCYEAEEVWIECWGANALRVRASKIRPLQSDDWALLPPATCEATFNIGEKTASITNGKITASITRTGKITMTNGAGRVLLEEFTRNRVDVLDPKCSALEIKSRDFKPIIGGDYHLTYRLESQDRHERIYGMGQYQQPYLNLKGTDIELAHRNSQASVPFAVSSLGYGLLWNNPSIGRAVLGSNIMSFEARSTKVLDYWIVAEDTPAAILEAYGTATGRCPMMPEYGLGFWQCKLRYQNAQEILNVARRHRAENLPLDLIVIDFFHWPLQGDWRFDETYWPDPDAMIAELKSMGVELMISVWPYVDKRSENRQEMQEKGLLIQVEHGIHTSFDFEGDSLPYDATNPEARTYLWDKIKQNYYAKGIKTFWLDEAEPEYTVYDFGNYRYYRGPNLAVGNIFPSEYARTFYEGQEAEGQQNIVNLIRCAWAGSQRYGALVWSGDIASSWPTMRDQLAAGLNMGMAGIPWWTTDIGGFHGGDPNDPAFRELFVRWFQWGAYCPVMRLHGDREPRQPQQGTTGGATCRSGADNEVWSYGDEVLQICRKYMNVREEMRDYTRGLMRQAHEKNTPVIRTCFFEFPKDPQCWEVEDQYFYGDKYLVAPVLNPGQRARTVYLPEGARWRDINSRAEHVGGQRIEVACPLDSMPVLERL